MVAELKRGQVSIFMIIGIVILLIVLVVVIISFNTVTIDDNVVVPTELMPAKTYLDYCMDSATENALFILGRQGGFITIPLEARSNPDRRISFGNGAEMVPFWYYENRNWIPTLQHMEKELTDYINEEFVSCINEVQFLNLGYTITALAKNATTTVSINEKDISVDITYPVEISSPKFDAKTKIKQFSELYDVKLKDTVELATEILNFENREYFLENLTLALMAMDANIPFTGMIPECGVSEWDINDIKSQLQYTLEAMYPEIRATGTDYFPFAESEEAYEKSQDMHKELQEAIGKVSLVDNFDEPKDYENAVDAAMQKVITKYDVNPRDRFYYFHMLMGLDIPEEYENFAVDFQYSSSYGMDIQAKPSENGKLKSNSIKGAQKYLSFLCLNMYHFTYDITYPTLVTLTDPDSFKGRGYQFRFAFPVIIRNNLGDRSKQHMTFLSQKPTQDNFCQDNPGKDVAIRVYDSSKVGNILVDQVNVSMLCAQRLCPLGTTDFSESLGVLRTSLTTACGNPYIIASKEGYLDTYHLVDKDDQTLELDIIPLKEYTLNIQKHTLSPVDESVGSSQSLTSGVVTIHVAGLVNNQLYEESFVYQHGEQNTIKLPLFDTTYDLSLAYLRNGEDYSGGYYGSWKVSTNELERGNVVTFHVVEVLTSTLDEDTAQAIGRLHEVSDERLQPMIS